MDATLPTTRGTREYVLIGLVLVALLNVIDIVSTYVALHHIRGAYEASPTMGSLIHTPVPTLLKIGIVAYLWVIGLKAVGRGERAALHTMFIVWVAASFYLVAVVSNLTQFVRFW